MNDQLIFRLMLLVLLFGFIAHRAYYTRKYPSQEKETLVEMPVGPKSNLANILSILALLSSLVFIVFPSLIAWAALPFPNWLRWVGLLTALIGFTLLEWSHRSLADNWSDQPRLTGEQRLVQSGPYRWVRHPIYTAFLLILGAPILITANWLIGGTWLLSVALDISVRMDFEENIMAERFGSDYLAYRQRTGKLFPKIKVKS